MCVRFRENNETNQNAEDVVILGARWGAEVEGRIKGSTLSRQVSVYFNLHIHISLHFQTASGGHLLTQDYQSTRGLSRCALRKISAKGKG